MSIININIIITVKYCSFLLCCTCYDIQGFWPSSKRQNIIWVSLYSAFRGYMPKYLTDFIKNRHLPGDNFKPNSFSLVKTFFRCSLCSSRLLEKIIRFPSCAGKCLAHLSLPVPFNYTPRIPWVI